MTVKDLRELLADTPDDMEVLIPDNAGEGFNGRFFSPCIAESGQAGMGVEDLNEEEIKERELLNDPPKTVTAFVLIPCGFFEKTHDPLPEMN